MAKLEKEFDQWVNSGEGGDLIWLNGGKDSISLLLGGNDEFTIKFSPDLNPKSYVFETRSKALSKWVARVNAEINQHTPASFSALLTKAVALFSNKNKHTSDDEMSDGSGAGSGSRGNSDDEGVDDDGVDDEGVDEEGAEGPRHDNDEYMGDDFDLESDNFKEGLEVLRKRKRWTQREAELRGQMKREEERKPNGSTSSLASSSSKVDQIFSSNAATGILTNDLLNIMQYTAALGFSADPVDDNIYHWRVKMFGFEPSSAIARHLSEINKVYGYEYVELEVTFTIDLYPFYPPIVKVVRPRFQGFMMGRVTSMELLKLSYWDPVKDMKLVLTEIRAMLQEHGKIDVNNPMNDLKHNPDGSYTQLEYLLLRLELLCEQDPRANLKYSIAPEKVQKQPVAKTKKKEEGKDKDGKYWASGTGYGHGHNGKADWDLQAYLAAQRQKDKETQAIIEAISRELNRNTQTPFDVLEESCLLPVLESYLRNDSLLDMGRHVSLYIALLGVVQGLAKREEHLPLLDALPHQSVPVSRLLSDLAKQCKLVLKRLTASAGTESEETTNLAEAIVSTAALVESGLEKMAAEIKKLEAGMFSQTGDHSSTTSSSNPGDNEEKLYMKNMKRLQFDTTQMDVKKHHYAANIAKGGGAPSRAKVLRLAQEQGSISMALPLNFSSSVFARVDEEHMDVMRALITGPDDTPYAGGCFQFDIYFPTTYPTTAPLVNLETTGSGSVRFNPNLYNCGKVCLSLLGTWSGAEGETWNKDTSTLLQVLVSIQSLILVPNPFFNEPGYEAQIGTPRGDQNSRQYNEVIRVATIEHAMVGQLRKPSAGFEDVIRSHFYYKREAINRTCDLWLADANNSASSKGHYAKLLKTVKDLRDELARLTPPGTV